MSGVREVFARWLQARADIEQIEGNDGDGDALTEADNRNHQAVIDLVACEAATLAELENKVEVITYLLDADLIDWARPLTRSLRDDIHYLGRS